MQRKGYMLYPFIWARWKHSSGRQGTQLGAGEHRGRSCWTLVERCGHGLSSWHCLWTDHCSLQGSKEKTVSSASLTVALSQYCLTKGSAPARRSHSSKMPRPRCLKCLLWCPVTHGSFWLTGFCSLQVSGWEGDVFHRAYNRTLALTSTTRRLTPFQNDMVRGF